MTSRAFAGGTMSVADGGGELFADLIDLDLGRAEGSRPCNGKPAAFGSTFAIDERAMAKQVPSPLEAVGERRQQMTKSKRPRAGSALGQAKLWAAFVKARDRYWATSRGERYDPAATAEAFEEMQETYRKWSFS